MKIRSIYVFLFLILMISPGVAQEYYYIKSLDFEGNQTFSDRTLKKKISTRSNGFISKVLFWKEKQHYNERVSQNDLAILQHFYQTEGFLDTRIRLDMISDRQKEKVELKFIIEEGEPVIVDKLQWEISTEDTSDEEYLHSMIRERISEFTLKDSSRFRDQSLIKTKQEFQDLFFRKGYPYTESDYKLNIDRSRLKVDVEYLVDPGPRCYFGEAVLKGNEKLPSKYIMDRIDFNAGKQFNQRQLTRTQRQIQQLGMFRYVTVRPELSADRNPIIPVLIEVKEAPRFTARLGVGYGREDRFRISLNIQKLGFLGGIRRLKATVKHSSLEPYHLDLKMIQPGFLSIRTSITLNPFLLREKESSYTIDRMGSNILLEHQFGFYSSTYLNYALELDKLDTEANLPVSVLNNLEDNVYRLSSASIGWVRDSSEPVLTPTRGMLTAAVYTYSGIGFKSDYYYQQFLLEFRKYRQILSGLILAGKLKIGGMEALRGQKETPLAQRFFAGGSSSVRGWARSELGPKDEDDISLGGNSLLEGSFEIRYPIWKILGGVLFVDFGNVWSKSYDYQLTDLQYAIGTGLRIQTPIGPGRLDIAFPVSEPDLPLQFHLSIGEAF